MLFISIFNAKEEVTLDQLNQERTDWYDRGCNKTLISLANSIKRYEIVGKSPQRIVFIIDSDEPRALNLLARHFGDMWTCTTWPVQERDMVAAMMEDKTIICG